MMNSGGELGLVGGAQREGGGSRPDGKTLTDIAAATGGNYYPLGLLGEGLVKVRSAVETLDRSAGLQRTRSRGVERFYWPVAVLLALLVAESLIGTRRGKGSAK